MFPHFFWSSEMSLNDLIKEALKHGDTLADSWIALQQGAKRVSYPIYETACIACIAEKYKVDLNADGTLPKANTGAYARLKRLRRAHPDFVGGTGNAKIQPAVRTRKVQGVADAAIAAVVAAGLSKAELMAVLAAIKSGVAFK
jgi:hypothetical protein